MSELACIAVTGASGFIGRHIVHHLLRDGHSVVVLSRGGEATGPPNRMFEARALPAVGAPDDRFRDALTGCDGVVHCAALNSGEPTQFEALLEANAILTEKLATAATRAGVGRFVYLSSIRAAVPANFGGLVDEGTKVDSLCPYGRSKFIGEQGVQRAFAGRSEGGASILRLAPVYGDGMKGNLARLVKLVDTPFPLPFGGLTAQRSLLSVEALCRAVSFCLGDTPDRSVRLHVVSDVGSVSVGEITASLRAGLQRYRRMVTLPRAVSKTLIMHIGGRNLWDALTAEQICDPSALRARGWRAEVDTLGALGRMAARSTGRKSRFSISD